MFFSVLGYMAYSVIRHGGFRGAMFGAKVLASLGEVKSSKTGGLVSLKLKVHVLEGQSPGTPSVGIELTSSGIGSWSTTGVALEESEVRELIGLLEQSLRPMGRAL